jgi:signal transduction histidine kinase
LRVVQEALVNVQKHARASHVDVHLGQQGESITVMIRDNGVGLNEGNRNADGGTGLRSMRERADLLGGKVEVASRPGSGTTMILQLPLGA